MYFGDEGLHVRPKIYKNRWSKPIRSGSCFRLNSGVMTAKNPPCPTFVRRVSFRETETSAEKDIEPFNLLHPGPQMTNRCLHVNAPALSGMHALWPGTHMAGQAQ